jgi:hypothetical protein
MKQTFWEHKVSGGQITCALLAQTSSWSQDCFCHSTALTLSSYYYQKGRESSTFHHILACLFQMLLVF